MLDAAADQFHAFFQREERLFALVFRDRHDDVVEQFGGAFDDVQMAVGQGVKTARVDGGSHGREFNNWWGNDEKIWSAELPLGTFDMLSFVSSGSLALRGERIQELIVSWEKLKISP